MLKTSLMMLVRSIRNHQLYTLINALGLSISLGICCLIALFVHHELSYDSHYANADRLYVITQTTKFSNGRGHTSSGLLAQTLLSNFEELELASRYMRGSLNKLARDDVSSPETVSYADPDFFGLFDFAWLVGDPTTALDAPNSIVLTRTVANKFFGTDDPLGKTLVLGNQSELTVTGVIDDLPGTTQLRFTALASIELFRQGPMAQAMGFDNWDSAISQTYVLLDEDADVKALEDRFPVLAEQARSDRPNGPLSFTALNVQDIYLDPGFLGQGVLSNLLRLKIFAAIGFGILLIAIVNFVNLATARSSLRAMEVGLRRTLGAQRRELIQNYLGEAIMMVFCTMILAFILAELMLPAVNSFLAVELSFAQIDPWQLFAAFLTIVLVVGIASGLYPAFYLTGSEPFRVLRGKFYGGSGGKTVRSSLVVFQFTVSIVLIIAAAVMFDQLRFMRAMDRGFDTHAIIMSLPDSRVFNIDSRWQSLESRLMELPGVRAVNHSASPPLPTTIFASRLARNGQEDLSIRFLPASASFLQDYRVSLLAGRYFSLLSTADAVNILPETELGSARGALIISEALSRGMGWTSEEALGQTIKATVQGGTVFGAVVGVVADTITSARDNIVPMLYMSPASAQYNFVPGKVNVLLESGEWPDLRARLEALWRELFPEQSPQLYYLNERVEAQYQQESTQLMLFSYAAMMAVLVACLGLFGLATFDTDRRSKEIGVRKAMGGSVWRIVLLVTNDFSKLVLVASLIAWALAYIAMNRWLENFAYRIDLTAPAFLGSSAVALFISWITVAGLAAKAASAKPVLVLRYE